MTGLSLLLIYQRVTTQFYYCVSHFFAYSPELNPDELVNGDLKLGVGQREPAANKEELRMQIVEHMEETKSNPEKVKNFFSKASVRYASNNHVLLPEQ